MVCAKDSLVSLGTVLHQCQSICMSTLTFPGKCQVVHARQHVWVIRPELSLVNLHQLHPQLLSLLPPALLAVCQRQVISSEIDFHIANENRLLPRKKNDEPIEWADWKTLARELLRMHEHNPGVVHPRFLRAELRLSRINTISRLTSLPLFNPYVRGRHNYGPVS